MVWPGILEMQTFRANLFQSLVSSQIWNICKLWNRYDNVGSKLRLLCWADFAWHYFSIDISSTISCNSWLLAETSIVRHGNCVIFSYSSKLSLCWNLNMFLFNDRELYNNNITGEIPTVLGNLTNLQSLDLYSNNITGPIPDELANLKKLRSLYDMLPFSISLISKTCLIIFQFCFFLFSIHNFCFPT